MDPTDLFFADLMTISPGQGHWKQYEMIELDGVL